MFGWSVGVCVCVCLVGLVWSGWVSLGRLVRWPVCVFVCACVLVCVCVGCLVAARPLFACVRVGVARVWLCVCCCAGACVVWFGLVWPV